MKKLCWLASASLFVVLLCLGPRVALLVVDLSPSQSLFLWFGLLGTSSHSTRCGPVSVSLFVALVCLGPWVVLLVVDLYPSQSLLLWFGLLRTLSRSARCSLGSVSIFHALCCSTPQFTLFIVDFSRQSRQSVSTFRALCWNIDSLCLLFSCLWWLSKYSYFRRTGSCKLMFHSPKLLSIWPFSHRFEFGFCLAALTKVNFCYCFPQTFTQYPTFARHRKKNTLTTL